MIRPGVLLLLATLTLASPAGAQVFYEAPVTPSPETAEPAEAAGDPIADLLDAVGATRVLFSTDAPLMDPAWTLGKLALLDLAPAALDAILRANAPRAFPRLEAA